MDIGEEDMSSVKRFKFEMHIFVLGYQCLQLGGRRLTNGGAWSGTVDDYCRPT